MGLPEVTQGAAHPELLEPIHVVVDDVHVRYKTPSSDETARRAARSTARISNRLLGREPTVLVRALGGVSLVVRGGESVGIVGLNGSGKSTLLRIVAGLERPSRGRVLATSKPILLGVSAALLPELTGRQNVRLGCLAMGMTPAQVEAAYPEIVDLAGIGTAIHHPMKTYSSGMGARLRFAIAAASNPEILLVDEALATGDAAFKSRSEERMKALRQRAGCVLLVSHAAQTIEQTCTRAVWLHKGHVVRDGDAVEVARAYRLWAWKIAKGDHETAATLLDEAFREGYDTHISLTEDAVLSAPPRHAKR